MQQASLTWRKSTLLILIAALLTIGIVIFQVVRGSNPASAQAAPTTTAEYFLKLDGIDGESTARGHENEIIISSYDWAGIKQVGSFSSGGGGGAGKADPQDISFTKPVDKATPQLLIGVATGEHIKDATLTVRKGGDKQQDYLIIKFSDVLISSYSNKGGPSLPTDTFSLNYAKVRLEYRQQDAKGALGEPIVGGFDFKAGTKL